MAESFTFQPTVYEWSNFRIVASICYYHNFLFEPFWWMCSYCLIFLRYNSHSIKLPFKVYNSVIFSIFSYRVNHHHYLYFQSISSLVTQGPLPVTPNSAVFPAPGNHWSSVSMDFPILDPSYNWNMIKMALCDWLLSLSIVFPGLMQVVIWIGTAFLCMAK